MGLKNSNDLAKLLGIKNNEGIKVKSKYGIGTTFYFKIKCIEIDDSQNNCEK